MQAGTRLLPADFDPDVVAIAAQPFLLRAPVSGYSHHDIYEDAGTIAFLARWPTLLGHTLIAPKRHIESWVHDLDEPQFRSPFS